MSYLPEILFSPRRGRNGLWDDFFRGFEGVLDAPAVSGKAVQGFAVDVKETPAAYEIKADLPGVEKNNVEVTLENKALTIAVRSEREEKKEEEGYVYRERWTGSAARQILLPQATDSDSVDAKLKDGVLHITVRKAREAQTRKITVS